MDVLENIIGRGTIFAQFLVGEDWDQVLMRFMITTPVP